MPSGLVRCWSCNAFMRSDVAERYQTLVDNPQKIIFSDVPPDERTETIPPRAAILGQGGYARVSADGEPEFVLEGEDGTDFVLRVGDVPPQTAGVTPSAEIPQVRSAAADPSGSTDSPAESDRSPNTETSGDPAASEQSEATDANADTESDAATNDDPKRSRTKEGGSSDQPADADRLLDIALTQEKEAAMRRRERRAALERKRILIPCPSCGAWMRVREEQSGKTVRCRKCRAAVVVPKIRRRESKSAKETVPEVTLDWVEDVRLHLVVITEVALKPGSLRDTCEVADVGFHEDGLHFIRLGSSGKKKKSFFSKKKDDDTGRLRQEIREHIRKTGRVESLPHGELHSIPVENLTAIRLVQPVRAAHESMFAGVPVFGEGHIAVYLPIRLDDDKQAFCSMTLSAWRLFDHLLRSRFQIELPAKENGVPDQDRHSAPPCHYTQAKVEAVRHIEYYENDSAYELELTGYRCTECGIAVSEAARAKNKLGGAAGKSIARAKCPACSKKFGREPLYRIARAPELPETAGEASRTETASGDTGDGRSASAETRPSDAPS